MAEKYTSGSWIPTSYRKYSTDTDNITTFPKTIIGDGTAVSAYTVKGNMEQSGTPTPSAPIYPSECGELETTGVHAGQYKLPLLSGSTPVDIYLGESQTTRRIKKLVLTGEENWSLYEEGNVWQFYTNNIISGLASSSCMSNIAGYGATVTKRGLYIYGAYLVSSGRGIAFQMIGSKDAFVDVASWKAYLAQQYANGTPVTVWYVLATPQTTTLNEPLRKIGTYADSVSGSGLPTSGQAESFDVGTTLKPSEVDLTYHGWHEKRDKVYTNGSWVENV